MLAVDQRRHAVGALAGLEQQRIAVVADERGVEREHRAQASDAAAPRALCHQHGHALHELVLVAAGPALRVRVGRGSERRTHQIPGVALPMTHLQRRRLRLPCRSRHLARHRIVPQAAAHRSRVVRAMLGGLRRRGLRVLGVLGGIVRLLSHDSGAGEQSRGTD